MSDQAPPADDNVVNEPEVEKEVGGGDDGEGDEAVENEGNLDYADWNGVDTMKSLCMACGENGTTHLMLHKIPYFRELIIASFACDECGERNNEVTFGGEIQLQGCRYELKVTTARDLDRQVIKSDSASLSIPEIEFEIPAMTQKGEISTIEGFLRTAAKNLGLYQEERMAQMPEVGAKVSEIILHLLRMAGGDYLPFTIILDDPAGNSFVQNPNAPLKDPHLKTSNYNRTPEQDLSLGLQPEGSAFKDDKETNYKALLERDFGAAESSSSSSSSSSSQQVITGSRTSVNETDENVKLGRSEVIRIPSPCPNCHREGECLTAMTDIPHFKEVIIMAFDCNFCGFRNNEVKGGGAVPTMGTSIILKVASATDLKRDVLKSDSSMVKIPELDLELQHGTLGGVYTTVEGLMHKIHSNLVEGNPFAVGDSTRLHHSEDPSVDAVKDRFKEFTNRLLSFARGGVFPFTLELRDPLGNSFISAPLGTFLPPEADENLTMIDFVRSFEENEEFGLNDINTRDFETGVDYEEHVLPDRLTHVVPKGPDHPHFFAKGVDDATPGGVYFGNNNNTSNPEGQGGGQGGGGSDTAAVNTSSEETESSGNNEPWFAEPPPGWKVEKLDDKLTSLYASASASASTSTSSATSSHSSSDELPPPVTVPRQFDEIDKSLSFLPYEEFSGQKKGYVFRLGAQGLGYYEDKKFPWSSASNTTESSS